LEVEPADPTIAVEDFSNQIEAWHKLGFHRPETDFFERDSPRCHFCVVPAAILYNGKSELRECLKQMIAILSRQLADRHMIIAADMSDDGFRESLRKRLRQCLPY
jgi:hypothetical protein